MGRVPENEIIGHDKRLIIGMPAGRPRQYKRGRSHYLWFGTKDNQFVDVVTNKASLKKLRRMIDKILGDK